MSDERPRYIFHLAPAERWHSWPAHTPYLPAEYAADGFVHCTAGEALMLAVANRFYGGTPGPYLLITLDAERLDAPLRWEDSGDDLAPQFPHLYGAIPREAVVAVREAVRAPDGTFQRWGE
ncbi:MAG: DUF952 domain-containing protein [Chloroflexales bacterium]|nr:DUF952 domain-containing protein [Chloroflexales bacterium]